MPVLSPAQDRPRADQLAAFRAELARARALRGPVLAFDVAALDDRLPYAGVGRERWSVELVRQRNGIPFSLEVDACDDTGRLALPAAIADRAIAQVGAASQAA